MAGKVYFALFINQKNKGNSLYFKVRNQRMIVFPAQKREMLNFSPSSGIDSVSNDFFLIIDTDRDNSHIFFPFFSVFVQHVLIVLHRSLAGSAPSCPNVDKDDFPRLMKELGTLFREDFMEVFVMRHFFADSKFM